MKKNTDKLMTKQNNPLGLILFTIIYFLVQSAIYPVLAYLFYFYIIFYWGFVGSSRADFEDFYNCVFVVLLDSNIGNYVLLRIFVQKISKKNE